MIVVLNFDIGLLIPSSLGDLWCLELSFASLVGVLGKLLITYGFELFGMVLDVVLMPLCLVIVEIDIPYLPCYCGEVWSPSL